MDVAFGLRAHSGWAALVTIGRGARQEIAMVDRRRLELIEPGDEHWARAPYHAAEGLARDDAHAMVQRGIESARRIAIRELKRLAADAAAQGHRARACGVLAGSGMPSWSVDEILAVHFRMHKAEGELFRGALLHGAEACDLAPVAILERELRDAAAAALHRPPAAIDAAIAALGRSAGPPWAADQKAAALVAWIALERAGA
jgi:hypothetical protein